MTTQEYARYVGGATSRRITARDWTARGIEQPTLTWNAANGFSIPRDQISDAAWEVLRLDPGLVLTDQQPTVEAMTSAKIDAAKARLLARAAGAEVLHSQDEVPGVDESKPVVHATTDTVNG